MTAAAGDDWKPLSLTYVVYKKDHPISLLLAASSLAPVTILIATGTLLLSRRDLHTLSYLLLQLCNELCNWTLKRWFAERRPENNTGAHFGVYGFPSQHAQFMGFFATYFTAFLFVRLKLSATVTTSLLKLALAGSLWLLTTLVVVGRVWLGHHSWPQVLWGACIGCALGAGAFLLVQLVLTPLFPAVVSWKMCEWLLVRDCTPVPNIVYYEYMCTRSEARNRARRQHNAWKNNKTH